MNARMLLLVIMLALSPVAGFAQESVRPLKGTGQFGAFLTPGQIDRWIFDGEKGETIIVHVVTKEFDPLLGLSQTIGKDQDKVLFDVDDPGNESRYMIRLPEKGQYKIRVHAFKNQGGGNYNLAVRRFQATPLAVGKPLIGSFDSEGKGYHYFQSDRDQVIIPQLKGAPAEAWTLLDSKGQVVGPWAGSVLIADGGECCVVVSGQPEYQYDLLIRAARRRELTVGKDQASSLAAGEMDVLSFAGKPGDFRVLEVEKKGDMHARLIYAPEEKKTESRFKRPGGRREIEFLPVASHGGRLRFAAILGRAGRYQLQLLAESAASYKLSAKDPSVPIELGKGVDGNLPVGGAAFYSFKATPGQLLHANLGSTRFVPLLRLYDARGQLVGSNGSNGDALEGRITHMAVNAGLYRLQVSSVGDGGGGEFRQSLTETKLKKLEVGGRGKGTMQPGATDFWAFAGKSGQTIFLNVRSDAFDPAVSVRSPDGVHLAADNKGNAAVGSLIPMTLPKTGRYTVWISSQRGAGTYAVRLIDGD